MSTTPTSIPVSSQDHLGLGPCHCKGMMCYDSYAGFGNSTVLQMVSILVPGMDQPSEAIVKRVPSTERVASTPLLPPSPAPLVRVDDQ
ncbi:hypothetical protein ANCDUO_01324 [Ancylostoma duodenale]|uniref:Uncharacterized protein n=1 Tax=Ancylostoma duodenale TaxID=51022 RepID=A0A0C2H3E3_9BILA|nr:hypothetical protein ANCDUO_01324 [Ancylostoma duodenale]